LGLHPPAQPLLDFGGDFADRTAPLLDPLHLPAALALGGDLPRPWRAHREALGQLLQRSFPTVIGLQQFAPQIVPIRFRHCQIAAESRRYPLYTYVENALALATPLVSENLLDLEET
jgi:hypothetical protein